MAKVKIDDEKIKSILERGVTQVIDKAQLERMLREGKQLRVKLGIDPTSPDLHLGHAVVLRKLREFQDLGHKIILIIGDFTARVGDPSGKSKTRPPLSEAEIKKNMKSYLAQAGKIIDIKKTEVRWNSEWHAKKGLVALLQLAGAASLQQVLKREDFKKRLAEDSDVTLLETLYPLLQGYDSVAIKADVELGGDDQLLNLLMGRRVQRHFGVSEQQVLTVPLLIGLDGTHKMSKSLGNYVALTSQPNDMFGKIMSIPDNVVLQYVELCTTLNVVELQQAMGTSPRDTKARVAFEIVKSYHGEAAAKKAEEGFTKVFSKRELISAELPPLHLGVERDLPMDELVLKVGTVKSRSSAWRLIEQGGLKINGETIKDPRARKTLNDEDVVRIGKHDIFRVEF